MSPIPKASGPGHEMSLLHHLEELRVRLTRMIIAAVIGFGICFAFAERILQMLLKPLQQVLPQSSTIQATELTEKFFVSMKAAFVGGIFLASPYLFYQIWSFIAPGLYEEERKLAIPVAVFTALCFVSGACFGYFVVFPYGFTFLANYASDIVTLNPKLSEYYSMALGLLFAFGIIFEMPVFIFFLARFGIVDHTWLRKKRRIAIVILFIVAAVVCPNPDVVSMLLMVAPMVILYEVSIWVAYFFGKKPKPAEGNPPEVPGGGTPPESSPPSGTPPGGGSGAAASSDAALEEARAAENPPVAELAGPDSGGSPDAHAAEREAHEQAALGHDLPGGQAASDAPAAPKAPGEPGSKDAKGEDKS